MLDRRQDAAIFQQLLVVVAKAQLELVNPEKSMIATIREDGKGGGEQTFHYASLSSGLDIVRKTGQIRDRCCASDRDRSGGGDHLSHNPAVPFVWRMDRLGLAGLSH